MSMDEQSQNGLIRQRHGAILLLMLNRPNVRNALDIALARELRTALSDFADTPELLVAIITGSDPAFCAGLDMKEFAAPDSPRAEVGALIRSLPDLGKPLIAAVNGAARAGGLELALGCDFILCSEKASFGDTHAAIGALSGSGMTSRLPFAVGARWAKQMVLTCEAIDAMTAARIGLANEIVAHDALLPRCLQLGDRIAKHRPDLIAAARSVVDRGMAGTLNAALQIEADALHDQKARSAPEWH